MTFPTDSALLLSLPRGQATMLVGVIIAGALFVNFVVKSLRLKGLNWVLSGTAFGAKTAAAARNYSEDHPEDEYYAWDPIRV